MVMTAIKIKREDMLRLNVASDVRERLERLSQVFGMPPSTLAALAVGVWVAQQERSLSMADKVVDSMAQAVGGEVGQQLGLFLKAQMEKEGLDLES